MNKQGEKVECQTGFNNIRYLHVTGIHSCNAPFHINCLNVYREGDSLSKLSTILKPTFRNPVRLPKYLKGCGPLCAVI